MSNERKKLSLGAWTLLDDAGKQVQAALKRAQETPEWLAYTAATVHLQKLAAFLGVTPDVVDFVGDVEMVTRLPGMDRQHGVPATPPEIPVVEHPEDEVHAFLAELAAKRAAEAVQEPETPEPEA